MAPKRARRAEEAAPPAKKPKTETVEGPRRSTRTRTIASPAATAVAKAEKTKPSTRPKNTAAPSSEPKKPARNPKASTQTSKSAEPADPVNSRNKLGPKQTATKPERIDGERQYWLMKAEPESRLENGVDVRFSIDDLAARTAPEPWDGIRNHVAKNNLLAMRRGDLAFFYHSNCKVPGIVGVMEVVSDEARVDELAFDPKSPYYDPKSDREKPRWFCPLVEFRRKFAGIVSLERLKEEKAPGRPLENMQLLRMGRLSVSRVEKAEWDFIMGLAEEAEREE